MITTANAALDTALRTTFAAIATPRRLMETENVARFAPLAPETALAARHHVEPVNVSMIPSADSPQYRAVNRPPTTAPPPATTTRAVVRPPSFSPPAVTSRTTATIPSTRSPSTARSGSRTRTWSPWMCWSLEAAAEAAPSMDAEVEVEMWRIIPAKVSPSNLTVSPLVAAGDHGEMAA